MPFKVPQLWESAADPTACQHIGYMIDGGKVYGYCEVDGVQLASCYHDIDDNPDNNDHMDDYNFEKTDDCHLDECNMYELNGEMVYITSANWPFVPPCLKGYVSTINGFTPSVRPT